MEKDNQSHEFRRRKSLAWSAFDRTKLKRSISLRESLILLSLSYGSKITM